MQKPTNYSNLFLDMNAFFASVEQQVQPTLRGKPICVAPYTGNTGCCIARSYEAKKYGISICSVKEAKRLCPQIRIIESRPELYIFYHRQILKVLESFSPHVEVKSVDEFNIYLNGTEKNPNNAFKMAMGLKRKIAEEVGDYLKCSIGVSSSLWLSKVAGESKKPDGLVFLALEDLLQFYRKLELKDLPGINIRMERQFNRRCIMTVSDLYGQPLANLSAWFGYAGRMWYYRLRGYEIDEKKSATKSVGHSHVLAPEYRTRHLARRVLAKMAEKCAVRLRGKNLWAGAVAIYISYLGKGGIYKYMNTDLVCDTRSIQRAALSLYDACRISKPPLKIAVTLFNLKQIQNEQISLFSDIEKSKQLSKVLDQINDKYGVDTIYPASMFDTHEAAPDRIPFGDPGRLRF